MTNFITRRKFTSSLRSVEAMDANLATIAGFILEQAHLHRNLKPAIEALAAPVFIDQRDGSLNRLGSQLKNYVVAHSRLIQIGKAKDSNASTVRLRSKVSGQEEHFLVDIAASRKAGERVFFTQPISESGATLLGFKEFTEYSDSSKPTVTPLSIAQINTRLNNLGKAISDRGIEATPAELEKALQGLQALQAQLLSAVASSEAPEVDTAALEQLATVKPSAKSKSAGSKVA